MQVSVATSYKVLKKGELAGKTVIVVNGFRANAVLITALANGCDRVIPVNSVEDAIATSKQFQEDGLLCGSKEGDKLVGFDLGNSPGEYTPERVAEKVLIHYSTNGSRAINASFEGRQVYVACLVNARQVAKRTLENQDDIYLVCAGADGRIAVEDLFVAGAVIDRMLALDDNLELDGGAVLALKLYREFKSRPKELLEGAPGYEWLKQKGLEEDIDYCLQEDAFDIVPHYEEGVLTIDEKRS